MYRWIYLYVVSFHPKRHHCFIGSLELPNLLFFIEEQMYDTDCTDTPRCVRSPTLSRTRSQCINSRESSRPVRRVRPDFTALSRYFSMTEPKNNSALSPGSIYKWTYTNPAPNVLSLERDMTVFSFVVRKDSRKGQRPVFSFSFSLRIFDGCQFVVFYLSLRSNATTY